MRHSRVRKKYRRIISNGIVISLLGLEWLRNIIIAKQLL